MLFALFLLQEIPGDKSSMGQAEDLKRGRKCLTGSLGWLVSEAGCLVKAREIEDERCLCCIEI